MGAKKEKLEVSIPGAIPFHDQHKEAYLWHNGRCISMASQAFRHLLIGQILADGKECPSPADLKTYIFEHSARAVHQGPQHHLSIRVAEQQGAFLYDLAQDRAVQTTAEGWGIIPTPITFYSLVHQQPQALPILGGSPWRVFEFLNVAQEDQLLMLVVLVSAFVPGIPRVVILFLGDKGSAKSVTTKVMKDLCDPSTLHYVSAPTSSREFEQLLSHHHCIALDNLSALRSWASDLIAQAATGSSLSKRKLYSDDDDIVRSINPVVIINGISALAWKPDLLDRTLLFKFSRIPNERRRSHQELWQGFLNAKPEILGGIFDTLARAMAIKPTLEFTRLPRMADFAEWGYAIAEALGGRGNEFAADLSRFIERQTEEIFSANTLAQALIKEMQHREEWNTRVGEAYTVLNRTANKPGKHDPTFPRRNSDLLDHLARIRPDLEARGISYVAGVHGPTGRPIQFRRSASQASGACIALETKDKTAIELAPDSPAEADEAHKEE